MSEFYKPQASDDGEMPSDESGIDFSILADNNTSFDILSEDQPIDVKKNANVDANTEVISGEQYRELVERAPDLLKQQSELLRQDSSVHSYELFLADGVVLPNTRNEFKAAMRDANNWSAERVAVQEAGIQRQFQAALEASERIRTAEKKIGRGPTIYAFRGISGSGKTFACKNNPDLIPGILDEHGEPSGVLATDSSKADIWADHVATAQIHDESSAMYQRLKARIDKVVADNLGDFSEVRDRVMDEESDVNGLIEDAKRTGRRVAIADFDIPFEVSASRVISREKNSPEPNPSSSWLMDTYANVRRTRRYAIDKLLEAANEQGVQVDYHLFAYDTRGEQKILQKPVAEIRENPETGMYELIVLDEELFAQVAGDENSYDQRTKGQTTRVGQEASLEARDAANTEITPEYIEYFITKYYSPDEESQKFAAKMRAVVESHMGQTLAEALDSMNKLDSEQES